jgi:GT2 family glycosyltransferase
MTDPEIPAGQVGAVAIGRNEGERLLRCLESLVPSAARVIYVDSGSTDDSVAAARRLGAEVVELDMKVPFTAARARNAGVARLAEAGLPEFIQFVDGDCELRAGWIASALAAMASRPDLAVVCGRRRERYPEASVYNRLIDREWDTPVGPAKACGGDALMRASAFEQVGGFDPALIAGEEPELCVRLRAAGWRIARIDAEMTLHDAAMFRFVQWWQRARRGGHAFAEGAALHGAPPERHWVRETRRVLAWGLIVPIAVLLMALVWTPWALAALLVYPAQMLRLTVREGWPRGVFLVLGYFAEAVGALDYYVRRIRGQRGTLIEYK